MKIPKNALLSGALTLTGFGLILYQALAYTGLYALASELQLRLIGSYFPYVSMIPAAVVLIPGLLTQPDPELAQEEFENRFDSYEAMGIYRQRRLLWRMRYWIPLTLSAAAGLSIYAQTLPATFPPPVVVDVSDMVGATPPLDVPVILRGLPDAGHIVVLTTTGRGNSEAAYLPMLAPPGTGAPRYFVALGKKDSDNREHLDELERNGQLAGQLLENGLWGEERASFEKMGVEVPTPHYLLIQYDVPPRQRFRLFALVPLGIALLLALFSLNALRLIRKWRRVLAEYED